MTRKLWSATLVKTSPRYKDWLGILGSDDVPIANPKPLAVELGGEMTEAYGLDLSQIDHAQTTRLVQWIIEHFGCTAREAVLVLESDGFPIRAADVSVSYSLRAFL